MPNSFIPKEITQERLEELFQQVKKDYDRKLYGWFFEKMYEQDTQPVLVMEIMTENKPIWTERKYEPSTNENIGRVL